MDIIISMYDIMYETTKLNNCNVSYGSKLMLL